MVYHKLMNEPCHDKTRLYARTATVSLMRCLIRVYSVCRITRLCLLLLESEYHLNRCILRSMSADIDPHCLQVNKSGFLTTQPKYIYHGGNQKSLVLVSILHVSYKIFLHSLLGFEYLFGTGLSLYNQESPDLALYLLNVGSR